MKYRPKPKPTKAEVTNYLELIKPKGGNEENVKTSKDTAREMAITALTVIKDLVDNSGGVYTLLMEEHYPWSGWEEMPDFGAIIKALKNGDGNE